MKKESQWYTRMLAKYGSDEAIKEIMRDNASKSSRNKVGTGGFAKLTPEERKEISRRGVEARQNKATESS